MSALITDEMAHTIAVVGTPEQVAEEIVSAATATPPTASACYFPGYPITDEVIAETVAAVKAVSGETA